MAGGRCRPQDPVSSAIFFDKIPTRPGSSSAAAAAAAAAQNDEDGNGAIDKGGTGGSWGSIPIGHKWSHEQVSHIGIPRTFEERYIRLYRPFPLDPSNPLLTALRCWYPLNVLVSSNRIIKFPDSRLTAIYLTKGRLFRSAAWVVLMG